jgi:hypothetical protein
MMQSLSIRTRDRSVARTVAEALTARGYGAASRPASNEVTVELASAGRSLGTLLRELNDLLHSAGERHALVRLADRTYVLEPMP